MPIPLRPPWTPILAEAPLVMAPELMLTEVTNTLARELVDEVVADRHLHAEALALACHLDHTGVALIVQP